MWWMLILSSHQSDRIWSFWCREHFRVQYSHTIQRECDCESASSESVANYFHWLIEWKILLYPFMSPMVSVALLPSQKYKRENIATRLIRHLLSQNGEKSRDMFVSDAILNQSSLDVRCVFVGCSALFWCEHTTLSTMLHRFKSAMWGMFRSEPSLRWIKTLFSSQSLWPLLFVNQDSILCLGPKREPDSVDFILLMILIFNASFGGLPRMVVQEDSLNKIFSLNILVPHVKISCLKWALTSLWDSDRKIRKLFQSIYKLCRVTNTVQAFLKHFFLIAGLWQTNNPESVSNANCLAWKCPFELELKRRNWVREGRWWVMNIFLLLQ